MGGMKGFMRIIEVILVLVVMFSVISMLVRNNPPVIQYTENNNVLQRYADDLKNMACNSEENKERIRQGLSLTELEEDMVYVTPNDLNHRLLVYDGENILDEIGSNDLGDNVVSSSCFVSGTTTKKVVVQAWY